MFYYLLEKEEHEVEWIRTDNLSGDTSDYRKNVYMCEFACVKNHKNNVILLKDSILSSQKTIL